MTPPAVKDAGNFAADVGPTLAEWASAACAMLANVSAATIEADGPGQGAPIDPAFVEAWRTLAAALATADAAASSIRLACGR